MDQSSVSRIERGDIEPAPEVRERLIAIIAARLDSRGDAGLRRLIVTAERPVHLICDTTHRLLAASRPRALQWRRSAEELLGVALWPYATDEIAAAEEGLDGLGWRCGSAIGGVCVATPANHSKELPIPESVLVWERMTLADGSAARLVSDLAAGEIHA